MAAKTTSCFKFLKEALILPTRNPKLFTPVLLLLAVTSFLVSSVHVLFLRSFSDDMISHLIEIKDTDPSSYRYAYLLEATKQDAVIAIPELAIALALGLVVQILAFFAASTTYSGECHTLAKLVREISKGSTLQGPSVTVAVVTALSLAWMAVLGVLLFVTMRGRPALSVQGIVFVLALLAFFCFTVLAVVSVTVSVADEEYRGVRALGQAWRLMTRVRRKEGLVLVLLAYLLQTVVNLVYGVVLVYANKSMAAFLGMLVVYAFLSGAQQLFYMVAATVYYYEATESKEVSPYDCAKIQSREGNF
uniref:Uncharacterized protein n=1 Tax=Avena sativa TaxID=4498 RepID=A0ACD5XQC7_AVESA